VRRGFKALEKGKRLFPSFFISSFSKSGYSSKFLRKIKEKF
jgi:hypothetical protein